MDYDYQAMSNQVYQEFAYSQHSRVLENPICEECKKRPSVQINRWGPIKACCDECLDEESKIFYDRMEADRKFRKEHPEYDY